MIENWIERQKEELILSRYSLIGILIGFYLLVLVMVKLTSLVPPIVTTPFIVSGFAFVPGALFLLILWDTRLIDARWIVYAIGGSLMSLMLLGLALNLGLPPLGVERPLSVPFLVVSTTILIGILAVLAWALHENSQVGIYAPSPFSPVPLAFAHLPFLSAFGVILINSSGDNRLLIAVLLVIAVIPLVVLVTIDRKWHSFGIWSMALAVLYHDALAAGKTYPGNPAVVRTYRAARWEPGTEEGGPLATELLQHGTIFPMFAHLTNLEIMTQMVIVNPIFVSIIPLALFVSIRSYIDSDLAFLAASMFVFAHPFYNQYPTAGRAATPVLFLALFAVVVSDSTLSPSLKSGLSIFYLSGIVFTHYGTSYFLLAALSGSLGILLLLRILDDLIKSQDFAHPAFQTLLNSVYNYDRDPLLITWSLVGFYTVLTLSWFLLTNDSRAFELLPSHAMGAIEQLFLNEGGTDTGRTGARLQRDYGAVAIHLSRTLYILTAGLIALGLFIIFVQRFFNPEKYDITDDYFVLGVMLLGIYGSTVVVRNWGGGRPMMVTFVFTLLFAVIAISWLSIQLENALKSLPQPFKVISLSKRYFLIGFTLIVAFLFILNSGVASALILPGGAPSNVPSSDGETNLETDVATHAWMIDNHLSGEIYGDYIAHGQTDWLRPAIVSKTENAESYGGSRPRNQLEPLLEPGAGKGYLLLLGHNMETKELNRRSFQQPMDDVQPEYRRNNIYTTGNSKVYYFDNNE